MTRLTKAHRCAQIINTGYKLSRGGGLYRWTVEDIAEQLAISSATVKYHYRGTGYIRRAVIGRALKNSDLDILSQAVASHDPLTSRISIELRETIGKYIAKR